MCYAFCMLPLVKPGMSMSCHCSASLFLSDQANHREVASTTPWFCFTLYVLLFLLLVRNTNRKRNSKSLAILNGQKERPYYAHVCNVIVSILSYQFLHSAIGYDSHLHRYNSIATSKLQGRQLRSVSVLLGLF